MKTTCLKIRVGMKIRLVMRQAAAREAMENEDEKSEDIGLLFS